MINSSRTQNTIRNIKMGFLARAVSMLFPFVTRSILIDKLGADYAGLSSLFSSLLQILNVSELGVSSAIIFMLYKPVADNDTDEINRWLKVYRTIYLVVGTVILLAGGIICPFVQFLIKGSYPNDINIHALFLIYLIDTVIGYLTFGYKRVILTVYQKIYVINLIELSISFLKNAVQIAVLILFHNFYLFTIVLPIMTFLSSVTINLITNRLFPEMKSKKGFSFIGLSKLSQQLKGVAIGRISIVTKNTLGNVIVSATLGLVSSGIYANYFYIFTALSGVFSIILQGMSASVGNSLVSETKEKNQEDHLKFDFYYELLVAGGTIGLFCLYQPFMKLWVGNELMLPDFTCTLFCIYFYVNQLAQIRSVYSEAAGLWWYFRYFAIAELITNVLLMVILGYVFGVNGILIANIITTFLTSFIGITMVAYRKMFQCSAKRYYLQNTIYGIVTFIGCILIYLLSKGISDEKLVGFMLKCGFCGLATVFYLLAFYGSNKRSRSYLIEAAKKILRRKNNVLKNKE